MTSEAVVPRGNMRAFLIAVAILTPLVALPQMMQTSAGAAILHAHGYCYLWNASLLTLHISADALIALSYLSISITLGWFVYSLRRALPFHWMFLAFGTFILACGATHAVEIWTVWTPVFWLAANVKIVTAIASLATALTLPTLLPRVRETIEDARVSEERRRQLAAAHAALRERQHTVEQFIQALPTAVLVLDRGGTPYYANRLATAMLGGEVMTRSLDALSGLLFVTGTNQPYPDQRMPLRIALTGRTAAADDIELRAGGSPMAIEVLAAPILDDDGRVVQAVAVFHDITDRKRLEHEFAQAQKMQAVGLLAGGIAHDFNNLLTVVYGYLDWLHADLAAESPLQEPVTEIRQAADRASGLTRHLLAFSRKQILQVQPLDLDDILAGMAPMLTRLLPENIQAEWHFHSEGRLVSGDRSQLEQIVLNLVINARDALPRGGRLVVETMLTTLDADYVRSHIGSRQGEHVVLSVTDNGIGMDPATRARIFEPFFTTKGGKGTGLGLSTVYGIVKQFGGNVWVYSEVGRGTTFKVYLPVTTEVPAVERVQPPPRGAGSERILLVEDDAAIRQLCAGVLRGRGYVVDEANDGERAVTMARAAGVRIDLVLTDVVLPGINGHQVAEAIVAVQPAAKVLFMSGYTENAIVHTGVLDPMVAFLPKPFTPTALVERVRLVLDGPPQKFTA